MNGMNEYELSVAEEEGFVGKKRYTVTIADPTAVKLIEKMSPWTTPSAGAADLLGAAVRWVERAGWEAKDTLSIEQRRIIVGATNTWGLEPWSMITPDVLAAEVYDYMTIGEGCYLQWAPEKIKKLCERLKDLDPVQALGLALWAKRAWESPEEIDEYVQGPTVQTITTAETAEILGVSEARIKYRLKTGTLPGQKVGRIWQIPREVVEKEAAEKASQSEPQ